MHIVFLTTEYPQVTAQIGGIAEYTRKISSKLVASKHKVTIIVAGRANFSKHINNVKVISFNSLNYWQGIDGSLIDQFLRIIRILINSYYFSKEVRKLNKHEKIDIVQSSNYLFPSLFTNSRKFPIICRISSYAPLLRNAYGKKNSPINNIEDFLELVSVKKAFSVFSPSKFMKETYSLKIKKEISVVKTPVDKVPLDSENVSMRLINEKLKKFKVITYFGSLSRLKGIDLIADIIPSILNKYKNVLFLFIGKDYGIPGYGSVKSYIRKKLHEKSNRIIIKGHLSRNNLFSAVQNSYCCLFPSRIDNLPNACIEAISLGIPVVASKNSSLEEMVIDDKTGFLFKNSDTRNFRTKLETMLNLSDERYQKMKRGVNMLYRKILRENRTQTLIDYYIRTINEFETKK